MKRKLLSILLIGIMLIGLTGCGNSNVSDNNSKENIDTLNENNSSTSIAKENTSIKGDAPDLIDNLNELTTKETNKWKEQNSVGFWDVSSINDRAKDLDSWNYVFISMGDKPFSGTYTATEWKSPDDELTGYDGKRYYTTVDWTSKDRLNSEGKYYLLVYDKDSKNYYNVLVTFEDFEVNNNKQKNKIYPIFSNSSLVK